MSAVQPPPTTTVMRLGDVDLSCRVQGPDDDAVPVVALHGAAGRNRTWDVLGAALAARGRRLVAPDLRAHGDSTRSGPYTYARLTDDVAALLDHLGAERYDLVGHSIGAHVAWRLAMAPTGRPSRVRRLVVEDSPAPAGGPPEHARDGIGSLRPANLGRQAMVVAVGVKQRQREFTVRAIPPLLRALDRPDPAWWGGLASVTARTLVVAGGSTSHVPQAPLVTSARLVPDGRFELFEGAGHRVHSSRPAEFTDLVVPFLTEP